MNSILDITLALRRNGIEIPDLGSSRRDVKEWVVIAEDLAEKNQGCLPNKAWLRKNGYGALISAMASHPDLFKHISVESLRKTPEEQVALANNLANEHNGILPSYSWLKKNGYCALIVFMAKFPKLFAHIKQDRLRPKRERLTVRPEKYVAIAEMLIEKYGEITYSLMKKHDCRGLLHAMRRYPHLFAHIPWEKKRKTPEEYVPIAQRLIEEHEGFLPNYTWLIENGYNGLQLVMRRHPNLFTGLKQKRLKKTIEEHLSDFDDLRKRNQGVLPCYSQLMRDGYCGLYDCIKSHPEKFARRNSKNHEC